MQLARNIEQVPAKKVAIYCRVSTIEQAEAGYSIDEQERLLSKYCVEKGHEIYQVYSDRGISGKNIQARPALMDLLNSANHRKFDIVLVWKTNRLARNLLDLLKMVDSLDKNNIAFKSYSETIETETPSGKLQLHMMAAVSEFERGTIAQNVKMGMMARAREGKWNGGIVLGYDIVDIPDSSKKRGETKLIINEEEALTVKKIFQLYIDGNGYKAIVNRINTEGHRSKKNNFFAVNTVRDILMNPVYISKIRYNVRRDWSEKRRRNINPDPIIVDGQHEAILDIDTWDKAQLLLKERSGKPSRVHDGEFMLTGIMKCPVCGAGMVISRTTNTLKDGTKKMFEYYACGAWKNKGIAACNSNTVRAKEADEYVLSKLSLLANSDTLLKDVVNKINNESITRIGPLQKEYELIKKELSTIQDKKSKVLGLYEEGLINKEDLSSRLLGLNEKRNSLDKRLIPIKEVLNQDELQIVSFQVVKDAMRRFNEILVSSSTREQRKQLIHLLIKDIKVGDRKKIDTIHIELNKDIVNYLSNKGEGLSLVDDPFSYFYTIYITI